MSPRDLNDYHMDGAFKIWPRRPTLESAGAMFFFASMALTLLSLLQSALPVWFPGLSLPGLSFSITAFFQLGFLLFPVWRYTLDHPGAAAGMRFKKPAPSALALSVMTAVVGVFFMSNLGTLWLALIESLGGRLSDSASLMSGSAFDRVLCVVKVGLLPAICEEALFRGMLLGAWERRGARCGILVSAALFAGLHASIEGLPVQFACGLALGFVVACSDSIYVGMLYHATHNILMLLVSSASPGSEAALKTGARIVDSLGGTVGVFLTLGNALLLGAVFLALLAAIRYVGPARESPFDRPPTGDSLPMTTPALLYLIAGIVTVACLLSIDLFRIMGVLP